MAFTPIETQEQLDAVVGERVARARETTRKEFEGWISPDEFTKQTADLTEQIGGLTDQVKSLTDEKTALTTQLEEKDGTIAKYETDSVKTKIAREVGLPYEAVQFLQGEDEETIRQNAESLKGITATGTKVPPLSNPETPPEEDGVMAAFKKMNPNIKL